MNCPDCSADNRAGAKFCRVCGANLQSMDKARMDTPSTASQPYQQPAGVTAPPTLPKVLVTQAASPTPPQQPMPPPPVKPTYQSLIAKNPVVSARIQNGDRIAVADIAMPFMSMVVFIVKWSLAAIPALLILAFVGGLVFTLISGLVLGALNF